MDRAYSNAQRVQSLGNNNLNTAFDVQVNTAKKDSLRTTAPVFAARSHLCSIHAYLEVGMSRRVVWLVVFVHILFGA